MKRFIWTVVIAAAVAGLTAYFVSDYVVSREGKSEYVISSEPGGAVRTVNLSDEDYPDFTYAAESAVDAVVYVRVVKRSEEYVPSGILGLFFGYGQNVPREQIGSGSGVIIRPDGYIVTNNHVVEGATEIEVTLNDNSVYSAKMIGTDPATDVAVIKIDGEQLPYLSFSDSDALRIGEWVLAIGSPYELRSTITAGIVSAKGRTMPNYSGEFKIESFIQTDAAVNPGNSGGALVNKAGALVGINTAIISNTGSYAGYSFAIPSNMARKVSDDIINYGMVQRAMLGVSMLNVDKKIASLLKLSDMNGVYITEVVDKSAADNAGIRRGDVLLKIGDADVKDANSVREAISAFSPGDTVAMTLNRNGKIISVDVTFTGAEIYASRRLR